MPDRVAILCPGQGAQRVGMGQEWIRASPQARHVFDAAEARLGGALGAPLAALCAAGPAERLDRTDICQVAIFVTSVACFRALEARPEGLEVAGAGGLSLGEYTALHLAGAISFADTLDLVALRGRAMQDAADRTRGGMVALIGADVAQAEQVCARARAGDVLVCANVNAPGQVVLSGHQSACERAAAEAERAGLRASVLPVAGAFHSPLMAPAADRLAGALERTPIAPPRCPVPANVTGEPHESDPASIRRRLVEQLTSAVRWEACARNLASLGATMHELAPGRTLAGLMRRIDRGSEVTTHDTPEG
jgi:[acyl-carrier-protein] S-malonyltransferase